MWNWAEAVRWLLLEGLLPLLGAGALYLLIGGALYIVANPPPKFKYSWGGWIDPMGWLYGAIILAGQAGWKNANAAPHAGPFILTFCCYAAGGISLLLLLAGMVSRGQVAAWTPPRSLKIWAAFLVFAILVAGFYVMLLNGGKS